MNSEEVKALISSTTEQKIEEAVQAKLASSEIQAQIDAAIEEQMASDKVQALIAQNIEAQMASEEIRAAIADNTEAQVQKAIADTMAGSEVQGKLAAASTTHSISESKAILPALTPRPKEQRISAPAQLS